MEEPIEDMPVEVLEMFLYKMSYIDIKEFALTSKKHLTIVRSYLTRHAHSAKEILEKKYPGSTVGMGKQQLIERVYFLTGTNDPKDIDIQMGSNIVWSYRGKKIECSQHSEEWYMDDRYHRVDGPARIEDDNGINIEQWYMDGQPHRVDGPARTMWYHGIKTSEEWYISGQYHRIDHPTVAY